MNKTAFITGSTSGIGKATAFLFAENGIDLVLCGRRKDRLKELQVALSKKVKIHTLSFDIRDKHAVQTSRRQIFNSPHSWISLYFLVLLSTRKQQLHHNHIQIRLLYFILVEHHLLKLYGLL